MEGLFTANTLGPRTPFKRNKQKSNRRLDTSRTKESSNKVAGQRSGY
jgi:hypothetical protein